MRSHLESRVRRASSAGGANVLMFVTFQLASVPVFLHVWGAEVYGDWIVLFTVPAYLGMADLGMQSAVGASMTMLTAADDHELAREQFTAYLTVCTVLAATLAAAIATAIWLLPLREMLSIDELSRMSFRTTFGALSAYAVLSLFAGAASAGYRSGALFHRGLWAVTGLRTVEYTWIVASVAGGAPPGTVAVGLLACRLLGTAWLVKDLGRSVPWLSLGLGRRVSSLRPLIWPSLSYLGFPVGNLMLNQGVLLAVSHRGGPVMVVAVNTCRTLSNSIYQLNGIFNTALSPEYSTAIGRQDLALARRLRDGHVGLAILSSLIIAILLGLVNKPLLAVWTDGSIVADPELFLPLLLAAILDSPWYAMSTIPDASNTHMRIAMTYVVAAGVSLAGIALTLGEESPERIGMWLLVTTGAMTVAATGSVRTTLREKDQWAALSGPIRWLTRGLKNPRSLLALTTPSARQSTGHSQ